MRSKAVIERDRPEFIGKTLVNFYSSSDSIEIELNDKQQYEIYGKDSGIISFYTEGLTYSVLGVRIKAVKEVSIYKDTGIGFFLADSTFYFSCEADRKFNISGFHVVVSDSQPVLSCRKLKG